MSLENNKVKPFILRGGNLCAFVLGSFGETAAEPPGVRSRWLLAAKTDSWFSLYVSLRQVIFFFLSCNFLFLKMGHHFSLELKGTLEIFKTVRFSETDDAGTFGGEGPL